MVNVLYWFVILRFGWLFTWLLSLLLPRCGILEGFFVSLFFWTNKEFVICGLGAETLGHIS
jgi:hypothetical protein